MDIKPPGTNDEKNNKDTTQNEPSGSQPAADGQTDNLSSPKPFTMDDPAQVVQQTSTPSSDTAEDVTPKPFTMDDSDVATDAPASSATPASARTAPTSETDSTQMETELTTNTQAANQPSEPVENQEAVPSSLMGKHPQEDSADPAEAPEKVEQNPPIANIAADGTPASPASPLPGDTNATDTASGSSEKKRSKLPLIIGGVLLLVAALAGFVFGYYLPNQPENVYSAGIERTGDAVEELVVQATHIEQLEELSLMELTGDIKVTGDGMAFEGDFTSRFDDGKSDSSFIISMSGDSADQRLEMGANIITDIAEGSQFPDIFFQVRGLEALGADMFLPGISNYENRWIHVNADYIKEALEDMEIDGDDAFDDIRPEDFADAARTAAAITNKYVFSSGENAVVELEEFTGEEDFDDIRTFRYDVSINVDNARAYCVELSEAMIETELYRKIDGADEERRTTLKEDARTSCDELSDDDFTDTDITMWVDRRTKLIHKVRFSEASNRDSYIEFGQRYAGGDDIEVFVAAELPEENQSFVFTVYFNIDTNVTTGRLTVDDTSSANPYNVEANMEVKPFDASVEIQRPGDAVPIETIIDEIMTGFFEPQPVDGMTFDEDFDFEPQQPRGEPSFLETMDRLFL